MYIHNLPIFWALAYLEQEAYSKPCKALTRPIQNTVIVSMVRAVYSGTIQPYSEPSVTLTYTEIWHIWNPGIFRTPPHNYVLTHIQNPVIFTEKGKPCVTLEIQNSGILTILEHPKSWHYLKPRTCTELSQIFKMERFATLVKSYNFFPKHCIPDLWQGSEYVPLSISTY